MCDNQTPSKRVCPHITVWIQNNRDGIKPVLKYLMSRVPTCCDPSCTLIGSARVHACLQCPTTVCVTGGHLEKHFQSSGHSLAMSADLHAFCRECNDYVYNEDIPWVLLKLQEEAIEARLSLSLDGSVNNKRVKFKSWQPTHADSQVIMQHATRPPADLLHAGGLRGFTNMGSTCFINAILQSLIHNQPLRRWFLSDQHRMNTCNVRDHPENKNVCLACDLDGLFQAAFSHGPAGPISPHSVLYSLWKMSNSLAGYEQQDAHEFFIAALNTLHKHTGGVSNQECQCVIHQLFGAVLRSEVTCCSCNHVSVRFEECLDISVEIPIEITSDEEDEDDSEDEPVSLSDCLKLFTVKEPIEEYNCENCGSQTSADKQLSIEEPPVTLCIQIKRFTTIMGSRKAISTKVRTPVVFPLCLDISPFVSQTLGSEPPELINEFGHAYELFAVVNHSGTLQNGHYTCFIHHRSMGIWINADDENLSVSSAPEALNSEAYVLFYQKRTQLYQKE